jgi:hypothetical protein
MNRRDTVLALLALGVAQLTTEAQPAKPSRIAYLALGSPESTSNIWDAFKRKLYELGHIEGRNVVFEHRWALGKSERLSDLAKELIALKPGVILALSPPTARAAHPFQRSRLRQYLGVPHQQHALAAADYRRALQEPLASRAVLQMDGGYLSGRFCYEISF